jgi:hypothetical protein
VTEIKDDAKRMATIASGIGGGPAGLAASTARAAANDARKAATAIATSKNPVKATKAEAAKVFKNWAIKPVFLTTFADFLGPTFWAIPPKLLFLDIYGWLASTGRQGTIKYNVLELLVLVLYHLAFIFLIIALFTLIAFAISAVTCLMDLGCAVGTVLG